MTWLWLFVTLLMFWVGFIAGGAWALWPRDAASCAYWTRRRGRGGRQLLGKTEQLPDPTLPDEVQP